MLSIDKLMDLIMEDFDAYNDYASCSAKYSRVHGCGVILDHAKTPEEKHIAWASHYTESTRNAIDAIFYVLEFDSDQRSRSYTAARAIRRWYNATNWGRLPSIEMLDQIYRYVIG